MSSERFINRELSWLEFNRRVLALAADSDIPLLERVKFCAIFSSNLDEFFQVRVAALRDQVAGHVARRGPDGRTPEEQLDAISLQVGELVAEQESIVFGEVLPALEKEGIALVGWEQLDAADRAHLDAVFAERVFPVLTPLAVDPSHPFPYISNLSLNLAVSVVDPVGGDARFARVKVPSLLPRLLPLADGQRFVALEQVIAGHLGALFPGMEIAGHVPFRVTRNADLTLEEEDADDLLAAVELELRRRRFGRAVRLEVDATMPDDVLGVLVRELDLSEGDVSRHRGLLDLRALWALHALDRPELKDDPWPPLTPAQLGRAANEGRSIFSVMRERDVLVHHPYESFASSTQAFIEQAADDPLVVAIKMTLYRTSGDSPIVSALVRAAERGVQVAALVELKARFDEQANIAWARQLEQAGVHVVYGVVGLKTHAKTVLVVREEGDGLRRYCHLGTGNYHSSTARLYEDLGLLTCDPEIGADLTQLFNVLTGYGHEARYRKLLVAPRWLRHQIQDLIEREASYGERGRIILKLNSIADPAMIESLYAASECGVSIDLIVRGICCLRPGVPGMSWNIRVRSILGRYLEHSRIYHFGNGRGPGQPATFLGSADLMPRNLDGRVESVVPIESAALQRRLGELLEVNLRSDVSTWTLGPDERWSRIEASAGIESQRRLRELAVERAGA